MWTSKKLLAYELMLDLWNMNINADNKSIKKKKSLILVGI